MSEQSRPLVYISYSHKDQVWLDRLRPYLQVLANLDIAEFWDDRSIDVGMEWRKEITRQIEKAQLVILLVSESYLASKFFMNDEVPFLLGQAKARGLRLLPVLLRPCNWRLMPWLQNVQLFPRNGKALSDFDPDDLEVMLTDLSDTINALLDDIGEENRKVSQPSPSSASEEALFQISSLSASISVNSQAWRSEADAFVLPVGPECEIFGATADAFKADIGAERAAEIERAAEEKKPKDFGPEKPILIEHGGGVPRLILATAYAIIDDDEIIKPRIAAAAVIRFAAQNGMRRILLPLLGASSLEPGAVIREMLFGLTEVHLEQPLSVVLVVIDGALIEVARSWVKDNQPLIGLLASLTVSTSVPCHTDSPETNDSLGFRRLARVFAHLLGTSRPVTPFAIGLFGQWGSGKSVFMRLIEQEVDRLPTPARGSPESPYIDGVAHISFNAWHYLDADLWACLALRIFNGLAEAISKVNGGEESSEIRKLRSELMSKIGVGQEAVAIAKEKLDQATRERDDLKRAKQDLSSPKKPGLLVHLISISNDNQFRLEIDKLLKAANLMPSEQIIADIKKLSTEVMEIDNKLSRWRWFYGRQSTAVRLTILIMIFGVLGWLWSGIGKVWKTITFAKTVSSTFEKLSDFVNNLKNLESAGERLHKLIAEHKRDDKSMIEIIDENIRKAENELQGSKKEYDETVKRVNELDNGDLVYGMLRDRSSDDRYIRRLGIISIIRADLEALRNLLADWREHGQQGKTINRIILYIDDLDRCEPDRVVEVLQAVHLLLAFDLFAVVVAVDPRWLEHSLYRRYLPEHSKSPESVIGQSDFTPQNYLEKIFQIPFFVPDMPENGFRQLIDDLAATENTQTPAQAKVVREETSSPPDEKETQNDTPRPQSPAETPRELPNPPSNEPGLSAKAAIEAVSLHKQEIQFIQDLHKIISTPRSAKRIFNLYLLVRASAAMESPSLFQKLVAGGDFRAVLLLLAIGVRFPLAASHIHKALVVKPAKLRDIIKTLISHFKESHNMETSSPQPALGLAWRQLQELQGMLDKARLDADQEQLSVWSPRVASFSFYGSEVVLPKSLPARSGRKSPAVKRNPGARTKSSEN